MIIRIIGQPFGSGIAQAKDKITQDARGARTIESTYRTLYLGWEIAVPARGTAHPLYPLAWLSQTSAQQTTPGYLCDVTLTYQEPSPGDVVGPSLPPDEYTESANEVEMPIEGHPHFGTFATEANGAIFAAPIPPLAQGKFKGWTKNSAFSGYMTFKVGSITESRTKYYWGQPSSITEVVGHVSGNWLTVTGSIARRYPYWTRTIQRIYSTVPWNTTIYPG